MQQSISIERPAEEVFAYLADPEQLRHWLPQLRREETDLPADGLEADSSAGRIRWQFDPAGEWQVTAGGGGTVLTLTLQRDTAPMVDPTEAETPEDAARYAAEAALQSLKSHLERAGGGDPDLHMPDVSARVMGRGSPREPV
jgi:hypothetical protein